VVGLAAEHKGAWVIIDLSKTSPTFCKNLSQIGFLTDSNAIAKKNTEE
jgi:ribosomal protein S8